MTFPPPAPPSPPAPAPLPLPEAARRVWLALVALVLLGGLAIVGGVNWLGQDAALDELSRELGAKARAVAGTLQRDLDRAMAYGIPLEGIPGVTAYLEGLCGDNPELRHLAVIDGNGHPLFQAGPGGADRLSVTTLPLHSGGTGTGTGSDAGRVEVAVAYAGADGEGRFGAVTPLLLGTLALLLLVVELLTWTVQASLLDPLADFLRTLETAAAGDFGVLAGRRGHDQIGRALAHVNGVVSGLHDLTRRFHSHAQEVCEAVFDAGIAGQVAAVRERVAASLGPSLTRPPRRQSGLRPSDLHPFLFTLTAAAAASLFAAAPPIAAAGPMAVLTALAAAAIPVAVLAPAAYRPSSRRRLVAAGLGVSAAAALATFAGDMAMPPAAGLALSGLGLGLVTAHATLGAAGDPAPLARLAFRTAGGSVAAGLATALGAPIGLALVLGAASLAAALTMPRPAAAGQPRMLLRSRIILFASLAFASLASLLVTAAVVRQATNQGRLHEVELAGDELVWQQIIDRETEAMTAWLGPALADPGLARAMAAGDLPALSTLAGGLLAGNGGGFETGPPRLDVIRADGELLYASATALNPTPLWSGALLARLVADGQPGRGVRRTGSGDLLVTAALPVLRDGRVPGALVAAIPLETALQHLAQVLKTPVHAVDRDGRLVFGTDDARWRAVAPALTPGRRAVSGIGYDGRYDQLETVPVSDVGGGRIGDIVVVRDRSQAEATRAASDRVWVGGTVLLVLLMLGVLYAYLRQAFEPLQEATETLEELARQRSGSYLDLLTSGDEIGRVSAAVDFVRGTLRELERLSGQRLRRRHRQQRFIRRQMEALAATLKDEARQAVLDDLRRLDAGAAPAKPADAVSPGAAAPGADDDDLDLLAPAFGRMASLVGEQQAELIRLVRELRETLDDKRRLISLQQELEIARTMQLSILPHTMPDRPEIDLAARMIPAKEVGGDFYDFFFLDDRRLGLVVADVSGKGIPAAFFMLITRTLLRALCQGGGGPGASLRRLNTLLEAENDQMMFVTLFYGELDVTTGVLTFCNAGHLPPLLSGPGRTAARPLEATGGVSLAVIPDLPYQEKQVTLAPGDTLTVFSDGITEAFDAHDEMFGDRRLAETVAATPPGPAATRLDAIITALDGFVGDTPQSDDITCLVLSYRGGAP